jgi:type IV pilus assembly protein PilC
MAIYRYVARTASGENITGTREAETQSVLLTMLRDQGLTPVKIEVGEAAASAPAAKKTRGKRGKIKLNDLVIFSRQLATMIRAGLPLLEVLNILIDQVEKAEFKSALKNVERDIQTGSSFCEALEKHPRIFDQFFVNMVRVGETAGMLDTILDQVAMYLEKTEKILRRIKSAVMYPAVVTVVAAGITIFLMIKVVPVFREIFEGFGTDDKPLELPLPTKITIWMSDIIIAYYLWLIGGIIGFFVFLKYYAKTPPGKAHIDRVKLKLPIFGDLFLKVAVARFTRTLGTLIKAGVNILTALEICAKTANNVLVERAVLNTRLAIQRGESLTKPLVESGLFPAMVTRMIDVGEKTGAMDTMLSKVADFYEDQVDATVDALTSLIEPLLIVFLGVVVGFIVISMFMPMFKMIEAVSA